MSTATLAGNRCLAVSVHVPAWGLAFAEVELDQEVDLTGAVELVVADMTFRGAILSGGPWIGRSRYRVVAGAGGWGRDLPAKEYRTDLGVKLSTVLGDAAREAGETIEGVAATSVGQAYERLAGPASQCLQLLAPQAWYVGTDGVTRLGSRPQVAYAGTASRGKVDLAAGRVELMADAIADIVPGVVVEGVEAVDVVHELRESKLRTTVYGSTTGTSKRLAAWVALLDQLRPIDRYRGVWEYRVVSQSGDRLNLQPARVSLGMPDCRSVRVRPGLPGCKATVALGSLVLVAFVNSDPGRPVVVGFDDAESPGYLPTKLTIDASSEVLVGAGLGRVLREGDTLTLTGVQAGGSATGVVAAVTLGLGVPPKPSRVKA